MVLLMSARASEKGLILTANVDDKIPPCITGDPGRLRQVLINLLGNAVKFTQQGGIIVRVDLEKSIEDQAQLKFSVIDTGIGIPKSEVPSLFDK